MSGEGDEGAIVLRMEKGEDWHPESVLSCYRNLLNETLVFFQGLFPPGQGATIGVDFMIKTVEINGEKVKVGA